METSILSSEMVDARVTPKGILEHLSQQEIAKLLDSFGLDAFALGAGDAHPPAAATRWAVGFPRERVHLQTYVGPLSHRAIVEPDRVW